ncbi:MAG: VWA domain-containing protein [Thermoguttaceae bacterium]|nr:VWA domain-containing protein [Thermoguttaceae bacterium]
MSRRLPIYVLVDVSGSMHGQSIQAVRIGLETLRDSLIDDPHASLSAAISVIAYGRDAQVLTPLTSLYDFEVPPLHAPETAPTNLGEGLELLCEQYDKEVVVGSQNQKGDWLPILVIMTDGEPTDVDLFRRMTQQIEQMKAGRTTSDPNKKRFGRILACAAGTEDSAPKPEIFQGLTSEVLELQRLDPTSFQAFICYVSDTISYTSQSLSAPVEIPPYSPDMNFPR